MDKPQNNGIPNPAFESEKEFNIAASEKVNDKCSDVSEVEQSVESTESDNQEDKNAIPAKGTYAFAELAIDVNKKHYIQIFHRIKKGELIIPSLKAGVFGLNWLIYRKAALSAIIVYVMLILGSYKVVESLGQMSNFMQFALIMGLPHVFFFFFGNFMYWYSVRKRVSNFRKKYGDVSAMMYLSEKGGVLKGFSLISSMLLLQGTALLVVYSDIYMESFLNKLWIGFLELAMLNS